MRPRIDNFLVRGSLKQLAETTYFSAVLREFTDRLVEVITHVIENENLYSPNIIRNFAQVIRLAQSYLAGSTTKEVSYEMGFCLSKAITHWIKKPTIITTALTADQGFHLLPLDPWAFIKTAISQYPVGSYDPPLVLIGVPKLYSHKPVYCIPLYHELGHFVDFQLGITNLSLLLSPASGNEIVEKKHRQEYFADLFAACFAGVASIETLETIAPNAAATESHPSTGDRGDMVRTFLGGGTNSQIALIQQVLQLLSVPQLQILYSEPALDDCYDDMRPCVIRSESELHGMFISSWKYLNAALDFASKPWVTSTMSHGDIDRVVNDLTEKSIRNMSIKERWQSGLAP